MTAPRLLDLPGIVAREGQAARVTILRAEGSTPQSRGAAITVWDSGFEGTVGGGVLEHRALATARRLLAAAPTPWRRQVVDLPLGPSLGQCCGGRVTLFFELFGAEEAGALAAAGETAVRPLTSGAPIFAGDARDFVGEAYVEPQETSRQTMFLYGAGHVGRAVVRAFAGLPFDIYWVDVAPERFPETIPTNVSKLPTAQMAQAAAVAPRGAWHVVMTYSHDIDFEICRVVLEKGDFAYLGLIASKTKRARFVGRLRRLGVADATLARLTAPIGLPGVDGKEPAVIAASLAGDFLLRLAEGGAMGMAEGGQA